MIHVSAPIRMDRQVKQLMRALIVDESKYWMEYSPILNSYRFGCYTRCVILNRSEQKYGMKAIFALRGFQPFTRENSQDLPSIFLHSYLSLSIG